MTPAAIAAVTATAGAVVEPQPAVRSTVLQRAKPYVQPALIIVLAAVLVGTMVYAFAP